ncbi:MAG: hypothetical protein NZL87_09380 [Thermomicrobium sp.]|nr:hypothetical protein [Thermomicrobium sp.]
MYEVGIYPITLLSSQETVGPPPSVPMAGEHVVPSSRGARFALVGITEEVVEQAEVREDGLEQCLSVDAEIRANATLDLLVPLLEPSELLEEHSNLELDVV